MPARAKKNEGEAPPAPPEEEAFGPAEAPNEIEINPLEGAELWRVLMPANGAYRAATLGFYVRDNVVVGTLGGASWALWQPWNSQVKPWLAKRRGQGTRLAPGERLEL